jgi:hypothetical protein
LAQLDGDLGSAFQKRKARIPAPDQSKFVAEQLAWIRDRNMRCELVGKNSAALEVLASSKPCMVSAIRGRITSLAQIDPAAAATAVPPQQPGTVPTDAALAAALADCDRQAKEQVERDDANWTRGPHMPRQFDPLWTQHVNEIEQQRQQCRRYVEAAATQRAQQARTQKPEPPPQPIRDPWEEISEGVEKEPNKIVTCQGTVHTTYAACYAIMKLIGSGRAPYEAVQSFLRDCGAMRTAVCQTLAEELWTLSEKAKSKSRYNLAEECAVDLENKLVGGEKTQYLNACTDLVGVLR